MPRSLCLIIEARMNGSEAYLRYFTGFARGFIVIALFLASHACAEDKINYTDHVMPLIEANCAKCHNSDKKKADLDLTSYQGALKGSGSGQIVNSGNLDGSKLWKALTHAEEPFMPPNRSKLPEKELDVFKQWILGGLLESAGGKAVAAARNGIDLTLKPEELSKPEGPPPMPENLPLDSVVHTARMGAVLGLAASPWAPLVAAAGQKQVLLFDTSNHQLQGILPFTEGEPVDLKFSHNGKLLLAAGGNGAKSGRVVVWDVVTGERMMTIGHEFDTVLAADIRPDQSIVALGGPGRLVKLYSTKTGELLHEIKKHTDWVTALAFSPNGQVLASADRNGGISLWDPDSAQELFTLAGHKSAVTALSWRPDSKLLASSSEDGTVKLWEIQEGKQVKNWTAHGSGVLCVSYARDGHLVTCGRDNAVSLWDANGSKKRSFDFFGNLPLRAVFSQDSSQIVATDFGGRCAIWNCADGKRSAELDLNPIPVAQQLAAAQARLTALQTEAETKQQDSAQAPGPTNSIATAVADVRAELDRLERVKILSEAFRLRERLSAEKQERSSLDQSVQAKEQAVEKNGKELAAAKELIVKTEAQLKSTQAEIARDTPQAERLAAKIQADQAELERLLAQVQSARAPEAASANTNFARAK
jgi:WD40 repeat protein